MADNNNHRSVTAVALAGAAGQVGLFTSVQRIGGRGHLRHHRQAQPAVYGVPNKPVPFCHCDPACDALYARDHVSASLAAGAILEPLQNLCLWHLLMMHT